MTSDSRQPVRKPATKFSHLRKKMEKRKLDVGRSRLGKRQGKKK